MPASIRTKDALQQLGIKTKNTLWRWEKDKNFPHIRRDINGHRIITQELIDQIKAYKSQTFDSYTEYREYVNENTAG